MTLRSRIVELTGSLPATGRQFVKVSYMEGREGALRGDAKAKYSRACLLGGFAFLHGLQAAGGLLFTAANTCAAARSGSMLDASAAVYDGMYTLATGAAVYSQAYLAGRVLTTSRVGADLPDHRASQAPEIATQQDRGVTRIEVIGSLAAHAAFMATVVNVAARH